MLKLWDTTVNWLCFKLCELFPNRTRTIPRADKPELPLLTQFVVIPEKLYLQHFHNVESAEWFHHHRWHYMRSIVLSSYYLEEVKDKGFVLRQAFATHSMDKNVKHRIEAWGNECWTLFYMGKIVEPNWGYHHKITNEFIPWYEFIKDEVKMPHIETGKITKQC